MLTKITTADAESNNSGERPLIVIASNRGPYSFRLQDGQLEMKRGEGGLVTALSAVAPKEDVLWVANALSKADRLWAEQNPTPTLVDGIFLRLVQPDKNHYERFYNIFANPLLWFIQHELWELPREPSITRETWDAWKSYQHINRQFAKIIAESIAQETRPILICPQDYHFYLLPRYLREMLGDSVQIQPFIHIPWAGMDAWRVLPKPMRDGIFEGLLASNRVGFQTQKDAFNFAQTCRFYLKDAHSGSRYSVEFQGRKINARAYPISIDVPKVRAIAQDPKTITIINQFKRQLGSKKLILRVDRVEPSKNILRGLYAYRAFLTEHPEMHEKVQMLSLLVPSRLEVDQYQSYLKEVMAEVGLINSQFSEGLWEPIRVVLGHNYPRAIAAMTLYDVLLVNPVADGMNLVAKEGVLINQNNGVLILSEYAGAYTELGEQAISISPYDIHSLANALHTALTMPLEERTQRANQLRSIVEHNDIETWFYKQIHDAMEVKQPA